MSTDAAIQDWIERNYRVRVEAGWIADVKARRGMIEFGRQQRTPCPPDKIRYIEAALRAFGMLGG